MTSLEMQNLLQKEPFEPFRIYLKDGRVLDILYPELNLVTELRMVVGRPDPADPGCGIADGSTLVHWPNIVKVEPLPIPALR